MIKLPFISGFIRSPTTFTLPLASPRISDKTPSNRGFKGTKLNALKSSVTSTVDRLPETKIFPFAANDRVISFLIVASIL